MKISELFLEFLGTGRMPGGYYVALGMGFALGSALLFLMGAESLFTLAFALFLVGIFEVNKYEDRGGEHNAATLMIDRVVGLWIAMTVAVEGSIHFPQIPFVTPIALGLSLLSYLLFEGWAPSTIGWIRREIKGGLGSMLDDVLAGLAAGLLTLLILQGVQKLLG